MNTDEIKRDCAIRIAKPKTAPKASPRDWRHMTQKDRALCKRHARRDERWYLTVGAWL